MKHEQRYILGMRLDVVTYESAAASIADWAEETQHRYVCAANVHMVMEAHDNPDFMRIVNDADMITPDGMPLVWGLRLLGAKKAVRVYGPTLTLRVCEEAQRRGLPLGLYGGTSESLEDFREFLRARFPTLKVVCAIAPPFRPLLEEEEHYFTEEIRRSGARILLVGIGCPKQEKWMAKHRERTGAVMLGVGAAFDFFSGRVKQAPPWMQRVGLEWLFRLLQEPKRLWRRYAKHNPRFVSLFAAQLIGERVAGRKRK